MHSLWERVEEKNQLLKCQPSCTQLPALMAQRAPEPDIASRLSHLKATNSMHSL